MLQTSVGAKRCPHSRTRHWPEPAGVGWPHAACARGERKVEEREGGNHDRLMVLYKT